MKKLLSAILLSGALFASSANAQITSPDKNTITALSDQAALDLVKLIPVHTYKWDFGNGDNFTGIVPTTHTEILQEAAILVPGLSQFFIYDVSNNLISFDQSEFAMLYPAAIRKLDTRLTAVEAATPAARSFSTPTFSSSTTVTRLSTTRDASVQYSYNATVAISLLSGQSITATLKYADNSGMSTNLVTCDSQNTSNSGVLGLSQTNTLKVSCIIPANKYRQVTFATSGGATAPAALATGQEVLE